MVQLKFERSSIRHMVQDLLGRGYDKMEVLNVVRHEMTTYEKLYKKLPLHLKIGNKPSKEFLDIVTSYVNLIITVLPEFRNEFYRYLKIKKGGFNPMKKRLGRIR